MEVHRYVNSVEFVIQFELESVLKDYVFGFSWRLKYLSSFPYFFNAFGFVFDLIDGERLRGSLFVDLNEVFHIGECEPL